MKISPIIITVLFILCTAGLGATDLLIQNETTPYGIVSFEFIGSIINSNAAMAKWGVLGKTAVGVSLGLDYLYIVLYITLGFYLLIATASKVTLYNETFKKYILIMAYLLPVAGIFDAIENFSLIKLLLGSQNSLWPQVAYYFAIAKFLITATCIGFIIVGQAYAFAKK